MPASSSQAHHRVSFSPFHCNYNPTALLHIRQPHLSHNPEESHEVGAPKHITSLNLSQNTYQKKFAVTAEKETWK